MTEFVKIDSISKQYTSVHGNRVNALAEISFVIQSGEFITIVGPSGSGKSTLLRMISGIDTPSVGRIKFCNGTSMPRIGFVFQANTIFPWRTIEGNLAYSLELKGVNRDTRTSKAIELCQLIGLEPDVFLRKYPKELSGGEQRRVAIGMALAHEANLLLLDEPTSQLDYAAKWNMQCTIQDLWAKQKFTAVLVTHDIDEAIFLGDQVLVLNNGNKKATLKIDLPRPREDSLRTSDIFNSYRKQIMECQGFV